MYLWTTDLTGKEAYGSVAGVKSNGETDNTGISSDCRCLIGLS